MSDVRRFAVTLQLVVVVEVELSGGYTYEVAVDQLYDACGGTGIVGAAIDAAILKAEFDRVCWGCNLHGKVVGVKEVTNV